MTKAHDKIEECKQLNNELKITNNYVLKMIKNKKYIII